MGDELEPALALEKGPGRRRLGQGDAQRREVAGLVPEPGDTARSQRDRIGHSVDHHAGRMRNLGAVRGKRSERTDRKSTRLNSSHVEISYAVFCLKKKTA